MVSRDDQQRAFERAQKDGCALVLLALVSMREVAARHDELRLRLGDERPQALLHLRLLERARVEIRHLNDA